jgi:hypothetical protein
VNPFLPLTVYLEHYLLFFPTPTHQLPTKLLKLFLSSSYRYLKYLCCMNIILELWNVLSKFIKIFWVKFSGKYLHAWGGGLVYVLSRVDNICTRCSPPT